MAFSQDSGSTFAAPVQVDEGSPLGRVAVVALPDGSAAVSWIEKKSAGSAEIRMRRVAADSRRTDSLLVSAVESGRKAGFPKMVLHGDRLMVTWTADTIRTVELVPPAFGANRQSDRPNHAQDPF